jgi:ribonucleotide reductase alpha subunit
VPERLSAAPSRNAEELLRARCYRRDENGEVSEDFPGLADRVASFLADAELEYGGRARVEEARELFRRLLLARRLLPSSPILMGAATPSPYLAGMA